MATVSGTFIFALPEDENSDQLIIKSSSTKNGTYSTDTTVSYEYGVSTYEYDSMDTTKWYKIQFNNSTDAESGPESDPVYGGNFSSAAPFLSVSTGTDGANYATTEDVYSYSSLTTTDVPQSRVSQALRRARAIIDLKTAELSVDRFQRTFESDVSRKKFNATLRVLKEAEVNIALGNVYRGISDDLVVKRMRDSLSGASNDSSSISIGSTALSQAGGLGNPQHMAELAALANRYLSIGAAMLSALQPTSVRMHPTDFDTRPNPKFKYPFNGWS